MPARNTDLHGFVPDKSKIALLLIDVINDLEFPEGEQMLPETLKMARNIAALRRRASRAGIPAIYVNDNFGRWQSDFKKHVEHCLKDGVRGKRLAQILKPRADDYFVLKPKHSGFYSTTLDILLQYLHVQTVIVTGISANICVLFTANDAYMRDFNLIVPRDCVVSNTAEENAHALLQMKKVLKADIRPSDKIKLPDKRRHESKTL
jgi:nicotinamidase-related amidase